VLANGLPCAACGNPSRKFLFKDKELGIPICSRKCEYAYLKNLSPSVAEHSKVVQYLDNRIKKCKERNRISWVFSGLGVLLILLGFVIPDVNTFIAGVALSFLFSLATRHFEDLMRKLTIQRKKLAI
jgi:lipid-A-disaccharide synthase-like uncharacterized protein